MVNRSWIAHVDKPARYTGGELYSIRKDPQGKVRFALCFPDVYEVGMSHMGSRILYQVLNDCDFVACERAYAPWVDAEQAMRAQGESLYALESGDPLRAFDILGFSLQYELSYTNVLNMLDLSGLALRADARKESDPLIVVGGPVAYNAEPLAPFVDLMTLGDGEETVCQLSAAVKEAKEKGWSKQELLRHVKDWRGFYVPSLYDVQYHADGTVQAIVPQHGAPARVQKAIVTDLEHATYPTRSLVPNTGIIHDRAALELFRGCTRGCRFCQAGYVYRPVRERTVDTLMQQAEEIIDCSGYDEISLTSLSSGDYPQLGELIHALSQRMNARRVSLSLPSLRIDSFEKDFAEGTTRVRKSGLTFAPEAGTQRLRDIINKGVTEEDLLRSAKDAFEAGYSSVKLYFMLGLPEETDEDLLGVVALAQKVVETYYELPKQMRLQPPSVTISVSPFVPKPFTPFQWEPQVEMEEIRRKQELIRNAVKRNKRIRFTSHDARVSFLEGVFARGDRRLADALEIAYRNGARLDGWSECFQYDVWMQAFQEAGLDPHFYAHRRRAESEIFPFEHIDVCISRAYLAAELARARAGKTTQDCRKGCTGCGLMDVCRRQV